MRICNLASGSKGNATFIEVEQSKFLIDIGLTCKETENRLKLLNVTPDQIDGILITHEHGDHIKGLESFAKKYGTKVFAHSTTWNHLQHKVPTLSIRQQYDFFLDPFQEKDLQVFPFAVPHDTPMCVAFSFLEKSKKATIMTDLGKLDENILKQVAGSSLVILESNHDVDMLSQNARYPAALKKRILGPRGHLSNVAAGDGAIRMVTDGARHLVLAHLSEENNTPQLAFETVTEALTQEGITAQDVKVSVAHQDRPTAIFVLR